MVQVLDKPVYPAANTVTMGGLQGVWPSEERCGRCGDCLLYYTGGICPHTACPKGLLHGPCGGSQNGECELEPGRPCGWQRIYDRLEALGRLDLLLRYRPPPRTPRRAWTSPSPAVRPPSGPWSTWRRSE